MTGGRVKRGVIAVTLISRGLAIHPPFATFRETQILKFEEGNRRGRYQGDSRVDDLWHADLWKGD